MRELQNLKLEEGNIVISPYGLAVIVRLFDEPIENQPSKKGEDAWPPGQPHPDFAAARIWVNGHGEEVIEIDQLVPATPTTMALEVFVATPLRALVESMTEGDDD